MRQGRFSEEQIINVLKKLRIWAIDETAMHASWR